MERGVEVLWKCVKKGRFCSHLSRMFTPSKYGYYTGLKFRLLNSRLEV